MSTRYTLAAPATCQQEIKRSRFIAHAAPIGSEDEAKQFLKQHHEASAGHNCWAWRIGQAYRFSDDGEPSGTAGKPILQAIDGASLDGVVVVVARWFGGILLGSGGLVRAYGGSAALCLRDAPKTLLVDMVSAEVSCTFSDLALLQARLGGFEHAKILEQNFTDRGACLLVALARSDAAGMERLVVDCTSGRAQFRLVE